MLTATCQTSFRGNIAIQREAFTLSIAAAKAVAEVLDCRPGTYWYDNLVRPTRSAVRRHESVVKVYVGGFTTGKLWQALRSVGCEIETLPDAQ